MLKGTRIDNLNVVEYSELVLTLMDDGEVVNNNKRIATAKDKSGLVLQAPYCNLPTIVRYNLCCCLLSGFFSLISFTMSVVIGV